MSGPALPENIFGPSADPTWILTEEGYDPLRESSRETRFAISNGFLGVRGERAFTRGRRWTTPARTYVAGLFDQTGEAGGVPVLLPATDWLQVQVRAAGAALVEDPADVPSHRMTLDMRGGLVLTDCVHGAGAVRVRVRTLRLVSLCDRPLGLQLIRLDVLAGQARVELEAGLEAANPGLAPQESPPDLMIWRTRRSGIALAMAAAAALKVNGQAAPALQTHPLRSSWTWTTRPGQVVEFERLVSLARSTDGADAAATARAALSRARERGVEGVVEDHQAAWSERWASSDVEIDGDPAAQRALRFAAYHLNSAANPGDDRVSIGARALTGSDYGGHVFWDTEIFLLPFYCHTWPEAARALLMYRSHGLEAARAKARSQGWRGALYAWESAGDGAEATPPYAVAPDRQVLGILTGVREQHVSADVAYGVWRYWTATGDDDFLREAGAEILFETARFWASRATPEPDGRRHIRGVIGPDEYHETIDDNAFTNVMGRWNIERALEVADLMREHWPQTWKRLADSLDLDDAELCLWREAAEAITTGYDPQTGLFEQFAGFFGREQIDLYAYTGRSVPMDVVLGRERTQRSQVIKQADVVALLALLPEAFPGDAGKRNFLYYEPRCGHGSSLSPPLHGLVAARLGETDKALDYFRRTAAIDLSDATAAVGGGVHVGALGGLWMTAVFGFAGVAFGKEDVSLAPRLPSAWTRMAFTLQWRRRRIRCEILQTPRRLRMSLEEGPAMTVRIKATPRPLESGRPIDAAY
ncbi:MAG: glycoside hydrolase family 65 [Brevundimonas sp.]|jgi:trehalose/maltose hydrolase-like predicted phosphorylase|uniref:glycoside hydrolase family 65 protein n=1 Tax=Brevundimonas sp. TaxID=1871086 RepID=UPI0025BB4415|nr:glycosyl hydrolase family 65 protein [Brevundimonas sp.]MCH4267284.1 glycoside hydrolase family 65 [Brevundimonas sp.]